MTKMQLRHRIAKAPHARLEPHLHILYAHHLFIIFSFITTRLPKKKKKAPTNARQKKEATINACIDLTATGSIAGQALDGLSSQDKLVVKEKIAKTLKKAINKNVDDPFLTSCLRRETFQFLK